MIIEFKASLAYIEYQVSLGDKRNEKDNQVINHMKNPEVASSQGFHQSRI